LWDGSIRLASLYLACSLSTYVLQVSSSYASITVK
jgi:hypothetical protein